MAEAQTVPITFKRVMNAVALPPVEQCVIRRFEMPDLAKHGAWVSERLLQFYPHLDQQRLYGWLSGIVYNNEYKFLYQDHAVALALVFNGSSLSPRPVIREQFVFVEDRENAEQQADAAAFYADFLRWAKAQDAQEIVLAPEMSDVPAALVKKALGDKALTRQQTFVKL